MAHKRMFSKDITSSDAFREMPTSSQALYFHLGMEADDDGFLDNYKGLMRAVNATEDDLRILIAKRFLILFPSKIVVVKHWLINNTIRKDRYTETKHLDEKRALLVKENGAYTEDSVGLPPGNQTATQYRIEEDRKEERSTLEDSLDSSEKEFVLEVVSEREEARAEARAVKIQEEGYDSRDVKGIRKEAEIKFGTKFPNPSAQESHIKKMLIAGFSGEQQLEEMNRLLSDPFWGESGVDFKTVSSQIGKAKRKKFNKVSVSEDIRL